MAIDSHELPESELLEPGGDQGDALAPGRKRRLAVNGHVWTNVLIGLLLVAILAAGAYFRFTGQNWDDYTHLHPDERHMAGVTDQLGQPRLEPTGSDASQAVQRQFCLERYPDTQGVATTIFDSMCSTWYPLNIGKAYFYGELPLYVVKVASWLTATVSGNTEWMHYNQVQLVGRSVSAIADLITLVFLFLIGRRLYNAWIGLLAAGLYAAVIALLDDRRLHQSTGCHRLLVRRACHAWPESRHFEPISAQQIALSGYSRSPDCPRAAGSSCWTAACGPVRSPAWSPDRGYLCTPVRDRL
jgi:hypothetical protein